MNEINISIARAKKLHAEGKPKELHGIFDTGLLKAVVFGANDGIITTFAVVAGVTGANLPSSTVIILGLANMIADGISMALGDYLGERSEQKHRRQQFKVERWEVDHIPEEEEKELDNYLKMRSVDQGDRKQLIKIIKKHPNFWTELGFIDEMGVVPGLNNQIWKSGVITFFSFVFAGSLPLLPYFTTFLGVKIETNVQFFMSVIATASSLFIIGSMRTLVTRGKWWKNGFEMLGIGTLAATAAYLLGALIKNYA